MDDTKDAKSIHLQWHPAFYAGIQIEFEKEAEALIFENEYQLGTKPKEIDILIIKKDADYQVKKNIGQFFRKYNLIEYKSPEDSLNIDDFYKVLGYACFYKADSPFINAIKIDEITITFVTFHYPRKMMQLLIKEMAYQIQKIGQGIYYITGSIVPIQLIVTRLVSEKENFWLKNLSNKLKSKEKVQKEYNKNKENKLYKSVMDIIVRANKTLFDRREHEMCQALFEIYQEDLMEMAMAKAMAEITPKLEAELKEQAELKVKELVEIKATELAEIKATELAEIKLKEFTAQKTLELENQLLSFKIENQKQNLLNLMQNTNLTLKKAMDALAIPEKERKLYQSVL